MFTGKQNSHDQSMMVILTIFLIHVDYGYLKKKKKKLARVNQELEYRTSIVLVTCTLFNFRCYPMIIAQPVSTYFF